VSTSLTARSASTTSSSSAAVTAAMATLTLYQQRRSSRAKSRAQICARVIPYDSPCQTGKMNYCASCRALIGGRHSVFDKPPTMSMAATLCLITCCKVSACACMARWRHRRGVQADHQHAQPRPPLSMQDRQVKPVQLTGCSLVPQVYGDNRWLDRSCNILYCENVNRDTACGSIDCRHFM
jgi:hypothetical protein